MKYHNGVLDRRGKITRKILFHLFFQEHFPNKRRYRSTGIQNELWKHSLFA